MKPWIKLNNREKQIVNLRFDLGGKTEKPQKEVADMLGISPILYI